MPRPSLLFALPLVLGQLSAQVPDTTILPRTVITATRVETPLGAGIASTTVLTGDALRRAAIHDVADALRLVPGVSIVRSGGPGAQTSLFVRGGESDYVRFLIDGVPVNDPGGAIDLANLTLDNVDRIEVVRGPVSVLYGTDAVSGVVQIFTRGAPGRASAGAGARVGRYGSRMFDASFGGGGPRAKATVAAASQRSDGILPFNNGYRNDVASARLAIMPTETSRASLTGRLIDDSYHYPTDGSGNVVDRNARRADRRSLMAFDGEQRFGPRIRGGLTLTALEGSGRTVDAPDNAADTLGLFAYSSTASVRRRVADARAHIAFGPAAMLTAGGEWSFEAQRNSDTSNYSPERTHFAADRSNRGLYAQFLGERGILSVSLGARYDDNSTFGDFRTGRAGLAMRAWRNGRLRATLGTAFKAPTFYETFSTAFSTGNPALTPERSRSWEVGAEQSLGGGRATVAATWFDQRFRDVIQYTFQTNLPNYFNVAAASARGLELEARAMLGGAIQASASTMLLRTRVDDEGLDSGAGATFVRGQRLLRRPGVSGSLQMSSTGWTRAVVDASLTYVGERDDRDFATYPAAPVVLPAYTRLDLGSQYRLGPLAGLGTASLLVRLENVLGTGYSEIFNFPAPGRALSVGVRIGGMP